MIARSLPLLAVLALAVPAGARAQIWNPSSGVPVCGSDCVGYEAWIAPDGEGGVYVAWTESRDYPSTDDDAYLQRITASGLVAPGWPPGGLSLCSLENPQHPTAIAPDGEGGVFVAWYDARDGVSFDVYVQRVRGDGTLAAGWPANGALAASAIYGQYPEAIAPDGTGGAYVMWLDERNYVTNNFDIYAQHLTATGGVAAGWPVDGLPVCAAPGAQGGIQALSDGAGSVMIVWGDCRSCNGSGPDTYGVRLLADGTTAPGWVENGRLLISSRTFPLMAPDDAGGFYVVCSTPGDFYFAEHWVHRFTFDGTPTTGWLAEGIPVCRAPGDRYPMALACDDLGGLLFTWRDHRGPGPAVIFASRVQPDGSIAPGWATDGVPVSQILGGQSTRSNIVADGSGGAYLCWEWEDYSVVATDAMVQHLTSQGAVAPGWPANGVPAATSLSQFRPLTVTDGVGGAIVVWEERERRPRSGLFAQRFPASGPTSALVALAHVDATPERVRLVWEGPGAGAFVAHVERRGPTTGWERLGDALADGPDRLRYEDGSVSAGARYAYRLAYPDGGIERLTAESWVDVPLATGFALRGVTPNPARDNPLVAFSLGSGEPATLMVFDVHGRLVFEREVGSLGPGHHTVPIDGRGALPAGVYSVRLRQGDLAATKRAVLVR